jgi:branched-chain amino acid transport system ATP-binding protein
MPSLEISELKKSFGGLTVIDDLDLSIDAGEAVGIIGPNGAGKTTLFNCISSVVEPDSGSIHLGDVEITHSPIHEIAQTGLVRSFQEARVFEQMTIEENIRLAAKDHPGEHLVQIFTDQASSDAREEEVAERASELMELLGIESHSDAYASTLSGGQRKLLDLARLLMADPEVILLDEPFAGVNPALTNEIIGHVNDINAEKKTLVVIEHEIENLVEIVDRLVVMHNGTVLTDGPPDEVLADEEVIEAYL